MLRNLIASLLLLLAALGPLRAYEYQMAYDQWRFSFADPSRIYRLRLMDRVENDVSWFEYVRSGRFGFHDNTFAMGWRQSEGVWGWEIETAATPHAEAAFREKYSFALFMPSIIWPGSQPRLSIEYRRHNEAAVLEGTAGIRQSLAGNLDVSAEGTRIRNRMIGIPGQHFWANAHRFEAGLSVRRGSRIAAFQSEREEFFESGSPMRSAFTSEETGGYASWNAGGTILSIGYSNDDRTYGVSSVSVNKFSASAGMAF